MNIFKTILKWLFARFGYRIVYSFPGRVTGELLEKDLKKIIKSDSPVCFDIGANIGQTIDMLQSIFTNPHIHAFEPSPTLFQTLEKKNSAAKNVSLYQKAMGEKTGQMELKRYSAPVMNSLLVLEDCASADFNQSISLESTEKVEIVTVDQMVLELGLEFMDLLKCDTQGYDMKVLQGAHGILSKGAVGAVLIELIFRPMYKNQDFAPAIIQYLDTLGYKMVGIYEKNYKDDCLFWCNGLFIYRR